MQAHAVYDILNETDTFILIKDIGHKTGKTVTNDAEYVIKNLPELCGIKGRRVFYIDSMGQTDEMIHNGVSFTSFRAGHAGVTL